MSGTLGAKRKHPKTHCKWGHEFTPENTWVNNRGGRQCNACILIRQKAARKQRNPSGKRITPRRIPECHPERKYQGRGLCTSCYMKAWCKEHGAESKRRTVYGMSPERYKQLYEEQNGVCAICQIRPIYATDHDHITGRVRGLLCQQCNLGLGAFLDDPNTMFRAIDYIWRSRADTVS